MFCLEGEQIHLLKEDVQEKFKLAKTTFQNAPKEDQEFLTLFSFICILSFDVYTKKLLIEKIIDGMYT